MASRTLSRIILSLAAGTFAACVGSGITESPGSAAQRGAAQGQLSVGPNLVECPTQQTTSSTSVVDALGGVVTAGGTSISIPAGALLGPTTVTVTVPPSKYMEVDVSAEGIDHLVFQLPVTVTLSYARCSRSNIDQAPLSVWYIDSNTKAPLELMGGIDDKNTRTVTFTTGHLSGYAVAN